ncbi:hypothetical protein D3C72_1967530 [compost metagenome]
MFRHLFDDSREFQLLRCDLEQVLHFGCELYVEQLVDVCVQLLAQQRHDHYAVGRNVDLVTDRKRRSHCRGKLLFDVAAIAELVIDRALDCLVDLLVDKLADMLFRRFARYLRQNVVLQVCRLSHCSSS